jgi:hypothetical protein
LQTCFALKAPLNFRNARNPIRRSGVIAGEMISEDPDASTRRFRRTLSELNDFIAKLPPEMQREVFLIVCAELLQPMSDEAVVHLRETMRVRFPELAEDSDVMDLIAGHLAWRELSRR